jgi:Mrp family chromosome partitioning ATPase
MRTLVQGLEAQSDLLVLDTPAALMVGDAIPLFEQVSGVVIVGRLRSTWRDAVASLATIVSRANGTLLGTVATDGSTRGRYGYAEYGAGVEARSEPLAAQSPGTDEAQFAEARPISQRR